MITRAAEVLALAHHLDNALQRSAQEAMRLTRTTRDEKVRDLLFGEVGEMRRLAEMAAGIARRAEEEVEEQRPRTRRELAAMQRPVKRRRWRILVGGRA